MKVLLLHPEDNFPQARRTGDWDLVVDLGRAQPSTYENWSQQAHCPVLSICDFAEEIEDLHRTRSLLQVGMGVMVDRSGTDWWDVLSLMFSVELQQLMMASQLARELPPGCELYSSRPSPLATALSTLLGSKLVILERHSQAAFRSVRRYYKAVSHLDSSQLAQVLQDKFDPEHAIRRRLTGRGVRHKSPTVLLPSAYINVSRTAVSYAAMLPEQQFLLVCARKSSQLSALPANVCMTSLDPYFVSSDKTEFSFLVESWARLLPVLISGAEEFAMADAAGVLARVPSLLRWCLAVRDAWDGVFARENITACLCADDSNPYTRIPLILARQHGLATLACHHGAMDYRMAMKTQHADFYIAKSEMEFDYLVRVCDVAAEQIVMGAPHAPSLMPFPDYRPESNKPWLVFFTEPYANWSWRVDEVYRDLLPQLSSLAGACGLKLVFKLHPFESVKVYRQLLRRHLPEKEASQIDLVTGASSPELWQKTRLALTVQSSVALECAARGIPVFLCSWLRDPHSGYLSQMARYGAGRILESPEQIIEIPKLLEGQVVQPPRVQEMDPTTLALLLEGSYTLPAVREAAAGGVLSR